jgi:hypothetical protein
LLKRTISSGTIRRHALEELRDGAVDTGHEAAPEHRLSGRPGRQPLQPRLAVCSQQRRLACLQVIPAQVVLVQASQVELHADELGTGEIGCVAVLLQPVGVHPAPGVVAGISQNAAQQVIGGGHGNGSQTITSSVPCRGKQTTPW